MSLFKSQKYFRDETGFSLLSLAFLILVLSFTGMAVITTMMPSTLTRQIKETADKAALLRAAIQAYAFTHGGVGGTHVPTLDRLVTTDGVACVLDTAPASVTYLSLQGWCGPYLDQVFSLNANDFKTDGWGTAFTYDSVSTAITSCGPDRICGDGDDVVYGP